MLVSASSGAQVCNDLYDLNPSLVGWVPHVMCFIVPRQIVPLGDPARRSCDACESFGAVLKKFIRHLSCRRRVTVNAHAHRSSDGKKLWAQTFKRGYVEQVFRRACVRSELIHGSKNEPYLQRADARLLCNGKVASATSKAGSSVDSAPSIIECVDAPTALTKEAALAVWS